MEQSELLRYVTRALEQLGLRYFVTGSYRMAFGGSSPGRGRHLRRPRPDVRLSRL
jgi:hypothetical protein